MRFLLATASLALLLACGQSGSPSTQPAASAPAAPAPDVAALQAQVAALATPYNEADYEAGRRVFAQCRACHTVDARAGNRVGPNLHGLFDREIGSVEGFAYSQVLRDANFVWTPDQLDRWLENPQTFLPGNRMAFAGVRDETQRRNLIAYLMVETTAE